MSSTPDQTVSDSEGTVDKRVKDRIINARERVDNAEYKLYIEAPLEHNQTQQDWRRQADPAWGKVVKQYLRAIEPLLKNDEITGATKAYKNLELGDIHISPPNKNNIPFRKYAEGDMRKIPFCKSHNLPTDITLPDSKTVKFEGLKTIISKPTVIKKQWMINIGMYASPSQGGMLQLTAQAVVPKTVYENAVRGADEFLQDAGVGLHIDHDRGDAGFSYGDLREEGLPNE